MKKALVVGASGLVGRQLVDLLLASKSYGEVRVLGRSSLGKTHPKLNEIMYNFKQPDATQVVGDDVFCCLGTTMKKAGSKEKFYTVDHEYPLQIARFSRQNGASKYLIVTAMGANAASSFFYNRVKGEIEEDLQTLGFEALHIFRPSLLLGDRQEKRAGEKVGEIALRLARPILTGSLKKYRAIESIKVARAMLRAAQEATSGSGPVTIHESGELQAY